MSRKTISSPFVEPENVISPNIRAGESYIGSSQRNKLESFESLVEKAYHFEVNERLDGVFTCAEAFKFYRGDRTREARTVAIIETLKCDAEPKIRIELCSQLKTVAQYCSRLSQRDYFYKTILENVIYRCLTDLIKDGSHDVRRMAKAISLEICRRDRINGQTLKQTLFQQAANMIENRASPIFKFEGLDLWFDLQPDRKQALDFIESYKRHLSEQTNQNEPSRAYYASKLKDFCLMMTYEQFKKDFLDLLITLSEDKEPSIRMQMAPVLVEIAKSAPEDDQEGVLLPLFEELLADSSRVVRNSAYELIGLMIFATKKGFCGRRPRSSSLNHRSRVTQWDQNDNLIQKGPEEDQLSDSSSTKRSERDQKIKLGDSSTVEFHTKRSAVTIADVRVMIAGNKSISPKEPLRVVQKMRQWKGGARVSRAPLVADEDEEDLSDEEEDDGSEDEDGEGDTEDAGQEVEIGKGKGEGEGKGKDNENSDQKIEVEGVSDAGEEKVEDSENKDQFEESIYKKVSFENNQPDKSEEQEADKENRMETEDDKDQGFHEADLTPDNLVKPFDEISTKKADDSLHSAKSGQSGSRSEAKDANISNPADKASTSFDISMSVVGSHRPSLIKTFSSTINSSNKSSSSCAMAWDFDEVVDNQTVISRTLFRHFLEMIYIEENGMMENCARNFPAVTAALGKEYWHLLKPLFTKLENDIDWKVRQKIAASLHEIAKILGPVQAEDELLSTFESCFNDVDEVRLVMVKNLANFLFCLGAEESTRQLRNLAEFAECENENCWRYRLYMTQQLAKMIEYLSSKDIDKYIWPMAKYYAIDRISEVRKGAFFLISKILKVGLQRKDHDMISHVKEFIFKHFYSVESCKGKVAFIQMCAIMVKIIDYVWFSTNFGDALLALQTRHVKDIQIALDKCLNVVETIHQREAVKRQSLANIKKVTVQT